MKLDDLYENKDQVASTVEVELKESMTDFGYQIVIALVTDISPDDKVKAAMNDINAAVREREAAKRAMPIPLMLATLTDRRDFGDDWLLERKLDGERCVARKSGKEVLLESRTGRDLSGTYPEVRAAVAAQRAGTLVLDGELVVFDGDDLVALPLLERRSRLTAALRSGPALLPTEVLQGEAPTLFGHACRSGWEGLIAKRAAAPYTRGRSKDWLKLKCVWEQELVIGGYTEPAGSRSEFGALLVGYHENGLLRYAGKVGTGYSAATLRELGSRLRALETPESPFSDARPIPRGTHWIRPELVAQVGFAEWTNDGRLRQPRYIGLRDDKHPRDVVRERAQ